MWARVILVLKSTFRLCQAALQCHLVNLKSHANLSHKCANQFNRLPASNLKPLPSLKCLPSSNPLLSGASLKLNASTPLTFATSKLQVTAQKSAINVTNQNTLAIVIRAMTSALVTLMMIKRTAKDKSAKQTTNAVTIPIITVTEVSAALATTGSVAVSVALAMATVSEAEAGAAATASPLAATIPPHS